MEDKPEGGSEYKIYRQEHTTIYSDISLSKCLDWTKLSEDDLVGKRILDLGSGRTAKFAREALGKGIDVVSVNPELAEKTSFVKQVGSRGFKEFEESEAKQKTIAAWGDELPFKDGSFDIVISVMAVPYYTKHKEELNTKSLKEAFRVLKDGGKIVLIDADSPKSSTQSLEEIKDLGGEVKITAFRLPRISTRYNRITIVKPD